MSEEAGITGEFVLPADATIQSVATLPQRLRDTIGARDNDFALSRRSSRTRSKLIDARAARLLEEFRRPCGIAEAVARFSRGQDTDAEALLEEALPMLLTLVQGGLLVPAGAAAADPIAATLAPSNSVASWSVVRRIQVLDDTEVYQVRKGSVFGALKIARSAGIPANGAIEREGAILSGLDSGVTPRLLELGRHEMRSYVLTQWVRGSHLESVCGEPRERGGTQARRELLGVTGSVIQAYASLHANEIVHGDVHPRNVIVDRTGRVTILDFGLGRQVNLDEDGGVRRGGLAFFFEPELAEAWLRHALPPPASYAGEQYAVAALLYLVLAGGHYVDFSLERESMLHQIAELPMLPFAQRGVAKWPDVERILGRALSKEPAHRYSSLSELAGELLTAAVPRSRPKPPAQKSKLSALGTEFLKDCALGGSLWAQTPFPPPAASLNYGSTGIAYTLYRVACARDDAETLALADLWCTRSIRDLADAGAFDSAELDVSPEGIGSCSIYHGPAGVNLTQALIAAARGELVTRNEAIGSFIKVCSQPCDVLDVTLGSAGALLGCAFLTDSMSTGGARNRFGTRDEALAALLREAGERLERHIWSAIDRYGSIAASAALSNLGIAHGWAGLLYATLCWRAATGCALTDAVAGRLEELAQLAQPAGRGLCWPWDLDDGAARAATMSGWCNGSAGYVFLWTSAYDATLDPAFLELAEAAAWNVWESASSSPNLCCGGAGEAYALLNYYRRSQSKDWLLRARRVAAAAGEQAYAFSTAPDSLEWRRGGLYKGDAALALLDADLDRVEEARMPMFEREV